MEFHSPDDLARARRLLDDAIARSRGSVVPRPCSRSCFATRARSHRRRARSCTRSRPSMRGSSTRACWTWSPPRCSASSRRRATPPGPRGRRVARGALPRRHPPRDDCRRVGGQSLRARGALRARRTPWPERVEPRGPRALLRSLPLQRRALAHRAAGVGPLPALCRRAARSPRAPRRALARPCVGRRAAAGVSVERGERPTARRWSGCRMTRLPFALDDLRVHVIPHAAVPRAGISPPVRPRTRRGAPYSHSC